MSRLRDGLSSVALVASVSAIRNTNKPPCLRANNQLNSAVRALPTWMDPLGAGSIRIRTFTGSPKRAGRTELVQV